MVDKIVDISVIEEECGIGKDALDTVLENITRLVKDRTDVEKADFFQCLLASIKDVELLTRIIKMPELPHSNKILSALLDILLLRNQSFDNSDELINLRVLCAKVIAMFKDTSAVGTLLYCLNNKDENYKVRLACADALGRIGDKYAVKPLINVVQDEDEKSVYVQESATFALGILGDSDAIDPLISIMEAKQGLIGKFSFLKERIVEALGKLNSNNRKVLKVLSNALYDSSPMVRINAIEALMNSDYEEAFDLIKKSLQDEDNEVKRNALIALYNMRGRDILEEVVSLPGYSDYLKEEAKALLDEYEDQ